MFHLQPSQDGTLARSEGSWEGLPAGLLKAYGRRTLGKGVRSGLASLKAERRAASGGSVSGLRGVTPTVRFLCGLALLAALAGWGFSVGDGVPAWLLGLGGPLLAAVVWGRWWRQRRGGRYRSRFGWRSIGCQALA